LAAVSASHSPLPRLDATMSAAEMPRVLKTAGTAAIGQPPSDPVHPIRSGVRERILRAAHEIFPQRGMHGASVDDIVGVAGTNTTSFYRHFASKDALIAEFLLKVEADFWKLSDSIAAERVGDPRRRLESLFKAYLSNADLANSLGCLFTKVATTAPDTDAAIQKYRVALLVGMRARFLKLAMTSGDIRASELADALILLLMGVYCNRLSFMRKTGFAIGAVPIARVLIRSYRKDPMSRSG
jgi:AcrR family transcriptional regulator